MYYKDIYCLYELQMIRFAEVRYPWMNGKKKRRNGNSTKGQCELIKVYEAETIAELLRYEPMAKEYMGKDQADKGIFESFELIPNHMLYYICFLPNWISYRSDGYMEQDYAKYRQIFRIYKSISGKMFWIIDQWFVEQIEEAIVGIRSSNGCNHYELIIKERSVEK